MNVLVFCPEAGSDRRVKPGALRGKGVLEVLCHPVLVFLFLSPRWLPGRGRCATGRRRGRGQLFTNLVAPLQGRAPRLIVSCDPLPSVAQSKYHPGWWWLCDDRFAPTYSPPGEPGRKYHAWHWAMPRPRQSSINPQNEPRFPSAGPHPHYAGASSLIYELPHFACYCVPLTNERA